MKEINYEEIIRNITAEIEAKKAKEAKVAFDDIKLNKAQYNNYTVKYDSIDFGKGIKKIVNKIMNKLIKRTTFSLTQDQNDINHNLVNKIEELSSKVQYLENKVKILEEEKVNS
ncbi:MAG: hypothetical protein K6F15_11120 [Treponema sp.]|nr:hypothetical protein [Treponema sp.]